MVRNRFEFRVAVEEDNERLLVLLSEVGMPTDTAMGEVTMGMLRQPDFFTAERIGAEADETFLMFKCDDGKIVGMGARKVMKMFVDGDEQLIGYLGGLRSIDDMRVRAKFVDGYDWLKVRHEQRVRGFENTDWYLTTIMEANQPAINALVENKAKRDRVSFPNYGLFGKMETHLIPLYKRFGRKIAQDTHVSRVEDGQLGEAVEFVNQCNRGFQFGKVFSVEDLQDEGKYPGFKAENVFVYRDDNRRISGVLGVWDQRSYKQEVVLQYPRAINRFTRPVINFVHGRLMGGMMLPVENEAKNVYGTMLAVEDDEPVVFQSLVRLVQNDSRESDAWYLSLSFDERHPLNIAARNMTVDTLRSNVYVVHWDDHNVTLPDKDKVFHIEAGLL